MMAHCSSSVTGRGYFQKTVEKSRKIFGQENRFIAENS